MVGSTDVFCALLMLRVRTEGGAMERSATYLCGAEQDRELPAAAVQCGQRRPPS